MRVREVLEDIWFVGRGIVVVKPIDSWVDRFVWPGLVDWVNVRIGDVDSWFRSVSGGGGLCGGLAGGAGSAGGSWASVYKSGQRASADRYNWMRRCWRGSEKYR